LRRVEYIDELYLKLIHLKLKTVIENSWIYWWTLFETNSLEIKKLLRIVEHIDEFYLKLTHLKLKTFIENSWIYWWILFETNSLEIKNIYWE
jgi:hypothetical protein